MAPTADDRPPRKEEAKTKAPAEKQPLTTRKSGVDLTANPTLNRGQSLLTPSTEGAGGGARRGSMFLRAGRRLSSLTSCGLAIRFSNKLNNLSEEDNRKSTAGQAKPVHYENTYQLGPGEENRFPPAKVKKIIEETLECFLRGKKYSSVNTSDLTCLIAGEIKDSVKKLNLDRFKIVAQVTIGQNTNADIAVTSRSLWNPDVDNCACGVYQNGNLYAVAMVYGVYLA